MPSAMKTLHGDRPRSWAVAVALVVLMPAPALLAQSSEPTGPIHWTTIHRASASATTEHPRPTEPLEIRRHPLPDPGIATPLMTLAVRIVTPGDTGIRLFNGHGEALVCGSEVLAAMRTRARYAFAIQTSRTSRTEPYYGTIDVIRGPRFPRDLQPTDSPIPIVFDEEDITQLSRNRMITKFVVLEDPETALDYPSTEKQPIRYEATFADDAVLKAKEHGKILIAVHIGNRVLTREELTGITTVGSLHVSKTLAVQDASGNITNRPAGFVSAEEFPHGNIVPISFRQPCTPGSPCGSAADDSCPNPGADCPVPAVGVDPRNLLNNDLTNNFEYICDGGDRRPKVGWVIGGEVVNVDPEDTIADYRTAEGGRRFAVSNRVCLFAPRYVEVRVVQMLDGYDSAEGYAIVARDDVPEQIEGRQPRAERKAYLPPAQVRAEKRIKGMVGTQWSSDFLEVRVLKGFEQGIGWASMAGLFGSHHVTGTIQPEIAKRVAFADTLTQVQSPQIVGMIAGTGEVVSVWKTNEVRHIDLRTPDPSILRLEKTADRDAGKVGDEVTFVIRYTNTGKQPITNIAIVDSLTTRLAYVPDSADSDHPAVFTTSANEAGSVALRWEIKDPLPGGESGMVTFRTIIR